MLANTSTVVIPLSKRKIVLLLLGSLAFVGISVWLWSIADSLILPDELHAKGAALAGVAFFGLCGIYAVIKICDGSPGLIIDAQGIVDNSSGVSAGRIPWGEITGLKVSEIAGQRFLTIEVVNPRKYVERGDSFQRMLNAMNMKMVGSPINISSNTLQLDFNELLSVLTQAWKRYKG
jgi:hypothetical protein